MAWIARDENGRLYIYNKKPYRTCGYWAIDGVNFSAAIELPSDADEKLIGKHIDWKDNPVEI